MDRWAEINNFALRSGLHIAFDLNACWGRQSSDGELDWSMIQGLANETADMAAKNQSAVFAFQFGNELYSNVKVERYAADLIKLHSIIQTAWQRVGMAASAPVIIGPDNGCDDMSPDYLGALVNTSGHVMHAATYHDYWNDCVTSPNPQVTLNTTCIDDRIASVSPLLLMHQSDRSSSGR